MNEYMYPVPVGPGSLGVDVPFTLTFNTAISKFDGKSLLDLYCKFEV